MKRFSSQLPTKQDRGTCTSRGHFFKFSTSTPALFRRECLTQDPRTSSLYTPLDLSDHHESNFERDLVKIIPQNQQAFFILIVAHLGVSTSGSSFKHPGRVGDSPLPGSGLYADDEVHVFDGLIYNLFYWHHLTTDIIHRYVTCKSTSCQIGPLHICICVH